MEKKYWTLERLIKEFTSVNNPIIMKQKTYLIRVSKETKQDLEKAREQADYKDAKSLDAYIKHLLKTRKIKTYGR